jgi:hypothetical protein
MCRLPIQRTGLVDAPFWRHHEGRDKRELHLQARSGSVDRTRSPAAVSQKREYFKYSPETIGDFSLEVAKFGVWRPTANLQKLAIGGHFSDYQGRLP